MPNWDNFRKPPYAMAERTYAPVGSEGVYVDQTTPAGEYVPFRPAARLPDAIPRAPDNSIALPNTGTAMQQVLPFSGTGNAPGPGFGMSAPEQVIVFDWSGLVGLPGPAQEYPAPENFVGVPVGNEPPAGFTSGFGNPPNSVSAEGYDVSSAVVGAVAVLDADEWLPFAAFGLAIAAGLWFKQKWYGFGGSIQKAHRGFHVLRQCNPFNHGCKRFFTPAATNPACGSLYSGTNPPAPMLASTNVYFEVVNVNEQTGNPGCSASNQPSRSATVWQRDVGYVGVPQPYAHPLDTTVKRKSAVRPSLLPQLATPVGQTKEEEEPVPWALVPYLPTGLANVNPIEQTWRGPRPLPIFWPGRLAAPPGFLELWVDATGGASVVPRPGTVPVPVTLPPIVNRRGDGVVSIVQPSRFPMPPPPMTKERKPVPLSKALLRMIGHITEGGESLTAVWYALPKKCRSHPRAGRRTVEPRQKARDLWNCFGELNIEIALYNLITETLIDFLYGVPSRYLRDNIYPQHEGRSAQTGGRQRDTFRNNVPKKKKIPNSVDRPFLYRSHTVDEVRRALT